MSVQPVAFSARDGIAYVAIDNPPVNGLSLPVRTGLVEAFARVRSGGDVHGVVLHGAGKCFSAGGDIGEFGTPQASAPPGLSVHVLPAIEACGKPVVAAIHGYALGGGLELAMACHFRVATADAKLGLPEGKIEIIPLSGTQRLPRLVGLAAAIEMILSGEPITGAAAKDGLVDVVADEADLLAVAAQSARRSPPTLARDLPFPRDGADALIADARARIDAGAFPPFAHLLLDAIAVGIAARDFAGGLDSARQIYDAVLDTPGGKAARAAFLSRRASAKDAL